jgi:hypothetical protein
LDRAGGQLTVNRSGARRVPHTARDGFASRCLIAIFRAEALDRAMALAAQACTADGGSS